MTEDEGLAKLVGLKLRSVAGDFTLQSFIRQHVQTLTVADAQRGFSSVVLETHPLDCGHRFAYQSGLGDEIEHGFQSGEVGLNDVLLVHFVAEAKIVRTEATDQYPNAVTQDTEQTMSSP